MFIMLLQEWNVQKTHDPFGWLYVFDCCPPVQRTVGNLGPSLLAASLWIKLSGITFTGIWLSPFKIKWGYVVIKIPGHRSLLLLYVNLFSPVLVLNWKNVFKNLTESTWRKWFYLPYKLLLQRNVRNFISVDRRKLCYFYSDWFIWEISIMSSKDCVTCCG